MSKTEVHVPDIGGGQAEVIELSVRPGDEVAVDTTLMVLESDKATMEIPSPYAGRMSEFRVAVGDKVSHGDLLGLMVVSEGAADLVSIDAPEPVPSPASKPASSAKAGAGSVKAEAGGRQTLAVPDLGGASEVPVIDVLVTEGDVLEAEAAVIVLESDKATMEIPVPVAGKVSKVLVQVGDKVSTGTPMIEIDAAAGHASPVPDTKPAAKPDPLPSKSAAPSAPEAASVASSQATTSGHVHAGPAVRKLAREFGVDLAQVTGSGPKKRIIKDDVQAFVKSHLRAVSAGSGGAVGSAIPSVKLPDFSQFGAVTRSPMSRMHSLTADNMARSWLNVPHVTQFEDADITDLERFRAAQKAAGEARGAKLTIMPFLLKACAYALRTYPQFNVALDMDTREVVQKAYVHIGMAVDTPSGLMVPVIRDVDKKGLWELALEVQSMALKARDKKLSPAEMQGGCFTISSLGGIGGTAFTPIVNTPEVAILGISKASMKPAWDGSQFQPRLMMPMSLSYDHRAINGADAARFTTLLAQLLGDLRQLLL